MQEQQRPAAEQPVEKSKQAYEKPQLRPVKLFADQVLGNCRTQAGVCSTPSPNYS